MKRAAGRFCLGRCTRGVSELLSHSLSLRRWDVDVPIERERHAHVRCGRTRQLGEECIASPPGRGWTDCAAPDPLSWMECLPLVAETGKERARDDDDDRARWFGLIRWDRAGRIWVRWRRRGRRSRDIQAEGGAVEWRVEGVEAYPGVLKQKAGVLCILRGERRSTLVSTGMSLDSAQRNTESSTPTLQPRRGATPQVGGVCVLLRSAAGLCM